MSDIVERLRPGGKVQHYDGDLGAHREPRPDICHWCEAADEIERLRREVGEFIEWGEWLTVDIDGRSICNHNATDHCSRTDHVHHPMFIKRWWQA